MADRTFEMDLERMFASQPPFADSDLFMLRVAQRLDRGWTFRQLLIGGLGVVGGLIGGAQIIGSGLLGRLDAFGARSDQMAALGLRDFDSAHLLPAGLPIGGEALLMSAVLALVAVGFALTRAIKEI